MTIDRAATALRPLERALRPAQYLHALHIEEIRILRIRPAQIHAVDLYSRAGVVAADHIGGTDAPG